MNYRQKIWSMVAALLLLALIPSGELQAQQESLYTNYSFNRLIMNPGYAGSRDMISMTALYRHQWAGVPGAPRTSTVGIHSPLKNRKLALGVHLTDDRQGMIKETGTWFSYAYRIPAGPGRLSLGIDAGVSNYRIRLGQSNPVEPTDPLLTRDETVWLPNFGFGAYYYGPQWFIGASVPRLINNGLGGVSADNIELNAHKYRHYYVTGGAVANLADGFKLRGTTLVKWVENAPVQVDVAGSLLLKDLIWVGAAYRSNASLDFHLETNITPYLRVLYAYDLVLGQLGRYTTGSHEIGVGMDLRFQKDKTITPRDVNPRYF